MQEHWREMSCGQQNSLKITRTRKMFTHGKNSHSPIKIQTILIGYPPSQIIYRVKQKNLK